MHADRFLSPQASRARALFKNGLRTVELVAKSTPAKILKVLLTARGRGCARPCP